MASTATDNQILIAGGGISGLATSIALGRMDLPVRVMERAKEFSDEGAGIQLGPNATRILDQWGVLEQLAGKAVTSEGVAIGDGLTGDHLATVPFGETAQQRYGAPFLLVHRGDLHQALLKVAKSSSGFKIDMGCEALSFLQSPAGVDVTTNTGTVKGRALIIADGLWSRLRRDVDGGATMRFTGRTAWRGWVNAEDLPEPMRRPWTGLWLGKNAHVVHYPVRGGTKINVVAVINERWGSRGDGWNHEADADQLMPYFTEWNEIPAQVVNAATGWRRWSLFQMPPLRSWTQGAVTLIGDAAHPVLPYLAQGGAMAIEDAAVLAQILSEHEDDAWQAFRPFEEARIERTARTSYESRRAGNIYHMGGIMRLARNFVLRRRSPEALLKRLDWLYGFKVGPKA